MIRRILFAMGACVTVVSPAHALCIYKGVDNATTTIAQEYRDSRWVVRARVVSASYHWSDEDGSWTLYKLRPVENFKGKLPTSFYVFTERNSGGFYMDSNTTGPDLGGEYLLFLKPLLNSREWPAEARGARLVNYSCGQSKPWKKLTAMEVKQLRAVPKRP